MGITIFKFYHLGRYIVRYTFGNHVLRLRLCVAVTLNFRPYIRRYTSPNEKFEFSYPLIVALTVRGSYVFGSSFVMQYLMSFLCSRKRDLVVLPKLSEIIATILPFYHYGAVGWCVVCECEIFWP